MNDITFAQLSENIQDELKPPLDRAVVPEGFDREHFNFQQIWRYTGNLRLPKFIPSSTIDAYCDRFIRDRGDRCSPDINRKWRHDTPYLDIDEIKNICLNAELMEIMKSLIGYDMGLHLNLIEWTSTERDWHQDDYLNGDYINAHYAAVWFALDDIHRDSGPFQYVAGSHRWPALRRSKVWEMAPAEMKATPRWHADWPSLTQEFVSRACEDEIQRRKAEIYEFLPARKGDVLIWHGNLIHRGSRPNVRGMERRALIAHYSSIKHRIDMPNHVYYTNERSGAAGRYFVL